MLSWYYYPDASIPMLPSQCYHPNAIVMSILSWHDPPNATVLMLPSQCLFPSWCYHHNATITMLPSECYHHNSTILLPSRHFCSNASTLMISCPKVTCLDTTISVLPSQCYCPNTTITLLSSWSYCLKATILMLLFQHYNPNQHKIWNQKLQMSHVEYTWIINKCLSFSYSTLTLNGYLKWFPTRNQFPNKQVAKKLAAAAGNQAFLKA